MTACSSVRSMMRTMLRVRCPGPPARLRCSAVCIPMKRAANRALLKAWPDALAKGELAARTGYAPNGGGFANALGRLRTLQLIDGRGELRADETLAREARLLE